MKEETLKRLLTATTLESQAYLGYSVSRVLRFRLRVLAKYLYHRVRHHEKSSRLQGTKALEGSETGRRALVVATGPSAEDFAARNDLGSLSRNFQILAINSYNELTLSQIAPDYYVLTDPAYFTDPSQMGPEVTKTWDYVTSNETTKVVLPFHFDAPVDLDPERVVWMNTFGLEGWTRNTNPLHPRGYLGLTAFCCLAFAQFLGFDMIFVTGLDNTMFRHISLDENRRPVIKTQWHGYREAAEIQTLPWYTDGMASALQDAARAFADLHLFDAERIIHLDPESIVDAFPKVNLEPIAAESRHESF